MIRFLESIFGVSKPSTGRLDSTLVAKATDRLVDGTDPRLVAVNGYRQKLRPAVERTKGTYEPDLSKFEDDIQQMTRNVLN